MLKLSGEALMGSQSFGIDPKVVRNIAEEIDPGEVKRGRRWIIWALIAAPVAYFGFFLYFTFLGRGSWRRPVMMVFYASYLVIPPVVAYLKLRKARQARNQRIHLIMLKHRHCPHCGYDIRGLPTDSEDGATVCPECGCAWRLDGEAE